MPFREKTAWISLTATLLVWGSYFVGVGREIAGGDADVDLVAGMFVRAVLINVVLEVVLAIVVAALAPKDADRPADERERLIGLKATGVAYQVVVVGVVTVALSAPVLGGLGPQLFAGDPLSQALLITANGILLAVVAAELVRSGGQILYFRRGG